MRRGWLAICDRCGFEFHSYELQKEWNSLMVCGDCWDARHPQDFVRGVPERQAPPWTRPEPDDVFAPACTPITIQAVAEIGHAGCMIAGYWNVDAFECTLSGSRAIAQYAIAGCAITGNINLVSYSGIPPTFYVDGYVDGYVVGDYWESSYA